MTTAIDPIKQLEDRMEQAHANFDEAHGGVDAATEACRQAGEVAGRLRGELRATRRATVKVTADAIANLIESPDGPLPAAMVTAQARVKLLTLAVQGHSCTQSDRESELLHAKILELETSIQLETIRRELHVERLGEVLAAAGELEGCSVEVNTDGGALSQMDRLIAAKRSNLAALREELQNHLEASKIAREKYLEAVNTYV